MLRAGRSLAIARAIAGIGLGALIAGSVSAGVRADDAPSEPAVVVPAPDTSEGDDAAGPDVPVTPPPGWVDPTSPDVLLGSLGNPGDAPVTPSPGATTSDDDSNAGKPDREAVRRSQADAAPPVRPGFVDDYTRLWQRIEAGVARVERLKEQVARGRARLAAASADLGLAMRVHHRAAFTFAEAESQLDTAARDLYMHGTTDVDIVIGVLGSAPDELLRTLDSVMYVKSAANDEDREFRNSRAAALATGSTASDVQLSVDQQRDEVEAAQEDLARVRGQLAAAREELDALIAAAAPQTVVGPSGCPRAVLDGTVPPGVDIRQLCQRAVKGASTPQAAFAVKWALVRLGAPYACDGVGRLAPWRYDCSSYVSRAYAEGAGLATATSGWAPSTRNMLPWDGASLDPHYARISPEDLKPGDLVLYDTCPAGEVCPYRHVVMYLGSMEAGGPEFMAHTNECGGVAHVAPFWGTDADNFLGVRRVIAADGERVKAPAGAWTSPREARDRSTGQS